MEILQLKPAKIVIQNVLHVLVVVTFNVEVVKMVII